MCIRYRNLKDTASMSLVISPWCHAWSDLTKPQSSSKARQPWREGGTPYISYEASRVGGDRRSTTTL